jgi:hypothetical protein
LQHGEVVYGHPAQYKQLHEERDDDSDSNHY